MAEASDGEPSVLLGLKKKKKRRPPPSSLLAETAENVEDDGGDAPQIAEEERGAASLTMSEWTWRLLHGGVEAV